MKNMKLIITSRPTRLIDKPSIGQGGIAIGSTHLLLEYTAVMLIAVL
jgi:hypothetical protein